MHLMCSIARHNLVSGLAESLLDEKFEDSLEELFSTGEGGDEITNSSSREVHLFDYVEFI